MRWFSHRRRTGGRKDPKDRFRKPPSACTAVTLSPPVATQWYRLLLRAAYGVRRTPYYALSMEMTQPWFFCPWWPWPLTFHLDIRTRARILYSAPNRQVSSSYV